MIGACRRKVPRGFSARARRGARPSRKFCICVASGPEQTAGPQFGSVRFLAGFSRSPVSSKLGSRRSIRQISRITGYLGNRINPVLIRKGVLSAISARAVRTDGPYGQSVRTVRTDRPYGPSVRTVRSDRPYGPSVRTVRTDRPYGRPVRTDGPRRRV